MIEEHCPSCRLRRRGAGFLMAVPQRGSYIKRCIVCGYEEPFGEPHFPVPAIRFPRVGALQGVAALFLLLWAWRDAAKARRDAVKTIAPNPMVAAMSMSWDYFLDLRDVDHDLTFRAFCQRVKVARAA